MDTQKSGLAFIDVTHPDPMDLFLEWRKEVLQFASKERNPSTTKSAMCLATVSKDGDVSNRNVLVQAFDPDGFVFVTDRRSDKCKDIAHNPKVAATFLWRYAKDDGDMVMRQVRVVGVLEEINRGRCEEFFLKEPLFATIRSQICHQDVIADWVDLKKAHDTLLEDVLRNNRTLAMPDHQVGFKLTPSSMEFYYAHDSWCIADRVKFSRATNGEWKHVRLAA